ncbi:MAG TPA: glycoside hydrolase family 99-like domain-containing protein, partial [Vicinamibacterales bacterium]|nr:glycoside hydrolase family 99-like domain-containing protein [Vicinamibacterales bacterium]
GFDLSRLSLGDAAGLAAARLIHRRESLLDLSLRAGEADLVCSLSLLEHLPVDECLDALRRITRPGGLGVHVVDLVDHRFYAGDVASPFAFLQEPPSDALVHGSNRLRSDEWRAKFAQHGFAVERVEEWSGQPGPTAEEQARFAAPYRSLDRERLKITGARLFVRREGQATGRAARRVRPETPTESPSVDAQPPREAELSPPAVQVYQSLVASASSTAGPDYVDYEEQPATNLAALVKLIAFYLPQYHPIPQNDAWWGRGFTEWTNVSKAVPQFVGHYQPHLPGELGFYDLRVPDVQRRQVELARQYGLAGFCFYYYWFGGTRLLERPLQQFMADPAIDFPFCVCWANENWTRRWDGREDHVLMSQDHGHDRDAEFMVDLEPALRHKNYIRINGRPVVLVYRPLLLPDPAATATRWREHCQRVGLGNPFLVATHSFDSVDPLTIGFDAAVEFPPNTGGRELPMDITSSLVTGHANYAGTVYRYDDMWRGRLERPAPAYPFFRGVCPGFDNEARRPGNGSTYAFSTPASYGRWLEAACRVALRQPDPDQRLVFVNAWNEWAEGAHLEPDRRFGYAYLAETRKVVQGLHQDWTMLVVSHDACRGGAQRVLLDYIAWLTRHTAIRVKVLCLAPGEWLPRFHALADTVLWADVEAQARAAREPDITNRILDFCGGAPALIYGNSVAAGRVYAALQKVPAPIVTHVHELESSIQRYASAWFDDVLARSAQFIACSEPVRQNLVTTHGVAARLVSMVYSSIDAAQSDAPVDTDARAALRLALGLPRAAHLVMGCGIGMPFRKGADLFIEVGRRLVQRGVSDAHLCWIGEFPGDECDSEHGEWSTHLARVQAEGLPVTFLGVQDDVTPYLRAADVFLLTSREDPFPLVALEAAECAVPIVCFAGAGGMPAFVADDAGAVVPFADVEAMATEVAAMCRDEARRETLGRRAREKLLGRFTTKVTAPHLFSVSRAVAGRAPAVSVVVPNYNHARYLRERLDSIFAQTFRDIEVIVLDDASTDDSLAVVAEYQYLADVRVIGGEQNSGSTFTQWLKGIDAAHAEVIWMAESDDGCAPEFLETLLPHMRDPGVKLAYANSHVWNEQSDVVGDYTSNPYLTTLSATKWTQPYRVAAEQEMNDGLGVKNTILSASAVLFRKFDLDAATRTALQSMRMAGDWLFYAHAAAGGDIAYTPKKLSCHRRHDESVVGKLLKQHRVEEFFREFHTVQAWIASHYHLDAAFEAKWERYLRDQWEAFFPGRPFDEIVEYYPLGELRARIAASRAAPAGRTP